MFFLQFPSDRAFGYFPLIYDINPQLTVVPMIKPGIPDITLFCPTTQISFTGIDNIIAALNRPPQNVLFGTEIALQHYYLTLPIDNPFEAWKVLEAVKRLPACPVTILYGPSLDFTDGQTHWTTRSAVMARLQQLANEYGKLLEIVQLPK